MFHINDPRDLEIEVLVRNVCQLGEGPHWSESEQCLYYVDIVGKKVCRFNPERNENESIQVSVFFPLWLLLLACFKARSDLRNLLHKTQ